MSKPTVRAKFYVSSVSEPKPATKFLGEGKSEQVQAYDISLFAVTANGSEENKSFFTNTPTGSLTLNTVNEAAAKQFEVGKEYYLDFTPAE